MFYNKTFGVGDVINVLLSARVKLNVFTTKYSYLFMLFFNLTFLTYSN